MNFVKVFPIQSFLSTSWCWDSWGSCTYFCQALNCKLMLSWQKQSYDSPSLLYVCEVSHQILKFAVILEWTVFKIELNCFGHFSYVYFSCKGVKCAKLTGLLSHAHFPPKNNVMVDWARHLSYDLRSGDWYVVRYSVCVSVLRVSMCVCAFARESLRMCIVFSSWLHSEALCERRLCAVSRPWARAMPLSISCLSVSTAIHTSSSHRWKGTIKG